MKSVSDLYAHPHFGQTIEVNILGPQKVCNFDCVHCTLGPSEIRMSRLKQDANFTSIEQVLADVAQVLSQDARAGRRIETLYVAGNGEPTLHPQFAAFTKAMVTRRAEMGLQKTVHLACLTNGDLLADRGILEAANLYDETIVRFDAGTEKAFKKINRSITRSNLEKIILGARGLNNLSILATVTGGDFSLTSSTALEEWLEAVALLNPKKVYLQRGKVANDSAVTEDAVLGIAHWLERRLKIKARVKTDFAA